MAVETNPLERSPVHPEMRAMAGALSRALDPALLMEAAGLHPDPWQARLLRGTARQVLLLCSRQSGKSTATAIAALHEAIYQPPALVLLLSASLRQSQELFKIVTTLYGRLGKPVAIESGSALRMELTNGSRIVSLPGTEETVRGYSGVRLLVVDEASRVPDELYFSVRPMLAVSHGRIICLSTPFGKRGFFHEAWMRGGPTWERIKITAPECPRITPDFLAEERASMGEWWFKQEYMCEFVESVDQVFAHDVVLRAVSSDIRPLWEEA